MEEFELLSTVFIAGVSLPLTLFLVYWIVLDQAKQYTDKKVREVKR